MKKNKNLFEYQSNQQQDQELTRFQTNIGDGYYLHSRSFESFHHDINGQDYISIKANERQLCFVVCDGVGQSFLGDLGAKILGDSLLDLLWVINPLFDEKEYKSIITEHLNNITKFSSTKIQNQELPESLSEITIKALEGMRNYGSESMFAAGKITFDKKNIISQNTTLFCWLGDTEIHVLNKTGRSVDLGAKWTSKQRWSSHYGIKGTDYVNIKIIKTKKISKLIAFSDGFKTIINSDKSILNNKRVIDQQIQNIRESPESDDVTIFYLKTKRVFPFIFYRLANYLILIIFLSIILILGLYLIGYTLSY